MSSALLIIDVQEALCSGPEENYDVGRVIKCINSVSVQARKKQIPVIVVQHDEKGSLLERDTAGWQLAQNLITDKEDLHIYKQVGDSFQDTDLQQLLKERQVEELFICGLQTNYCVNATTRRALQLGYSVKVIEDAHSTEDDAQVKAAEIIIQHNQIWSRLNATLIKAKDVHF